MPDGLVRGLPKAELPFGTAHYTSATSSSWQASTISVPSASADDLILWGIGQDAIIGEHLPAGTQNTSVIAEVVARCNQTSNVTWSSIVTLRKRWNVAWPASVSFDQATTTYSAGIMGVFTPRFGFKGRSAGAQRAIIASSASAAITPIANPMRYPGGIAIAVVNIDTGGAGPNNSVTGTGWRMVGTGGTVAMAYYILPMEAIITPPTVTFSCSRSDTWAGCLVYLE